jgi:hypothetical protein
MASRRFWAVHSPVSSTAFAFHFRDRQHSIFAFSALAHSAKPLFEGDEAVYWLSPVAAFTQTYLDGWVREEEFK